MNIKHLIVFLGLAVGMTSFCAHEQPHFVIITASYKNAEWYQWNLNSLFNQDYKNWHLVYVDDCSPDGTGELVKSYIKERGFEDKATVICNKHRCGAMSNQYFAIHQLCKPTDIVVILDGDDWFAHTQVLSRLNDVYADGSIWLTYGQFREYPSGKLGFCIPMPREVIENNAFRDFERIPSHLRTFYAGLFHKIKLVDLMYEGGFFPMAPDMAAMMPMIEMARDHFKFISEVLLEYNAVNPISEHRISADLQKKCDIAIRALPQYKKIKSPF